MTDSTRDLDALRRVQEGDRAALSELYDRHSPVLFGLALRMLRDRDEAEDVLQDAWVQAWRRCATYDPSRGSVAGWLVTILRSRALDRLRRRATRGRAESEGGIEAEPAPAPNPADSAARRSVREVLAKALANLDPKQREVLEIAYFQGLSQSEVAERVGAPLGTVKYWTRQALLKLRELVPGETT